MRSVMPSREAICLLSSPRRPDGAPGPRAARGRTRPDAERLLARARGARQQAPGGSRVERRLAPRDRADAVEQGLGLGVLEQVADGAGLDGGVDPGVVGEGRQHQHLGAGLRRPRSRAWPRPRRAPASAGPSPRRRAGARGRGRPPRCRPCATPTTSRSSVDSMQARRAHGVRRRGRRRARRGSCWSGTSTLHDRARPGRGLDLHRAAVLAHEALRGAQAEVGASPSVARVEARPRRRRPPARGCSSSRRTVSDIRPARACRATLRTDSWASRHTSATADVGGVLVTADVDVDAARRLRPGRDEVLRRPRRDRRCAGRAGRSRRAGSAASACSPAASGRRPRARPTRRPALRAARVDSAIEDPARSWTTPSCRSRAIRRRSASEARTAASSRRSRSRAPRDRRRVSSSIRGRRRAAPARRGRRW